jgi:hypothetical protein
MGKRPARLLLDFADTLASSIQTTPASGLAK